MKYLVVVAFSLIGLLVSAQKVTDYQYIAVPTNFSDFTENQYQLNNYLRMLISKKGFEILPENQNFWPEEVRKMPCAVLEADIVKEKSMFTNKLQLKFIDCNGNSVEIFSGESREKDYAKGYRDALQEASSKITNYSGKQMVSVASKTVNQTIQVLEPETITEPIEPDKIVIKNQPQPIKKSISPPEATITAQNNVAYTNGYQTFYKIVKGTNQFDLNTADGKTMARFIPATQGGIYHVTIMDADGASSYQTIGYLQGDEIWFETTTDQVNWKLQTFIKK